MQARFSAACVEVDGEAHKYIRTAESGDAIQFHFCPDCGATVFYTLDALPGFVSVPIGAFADPDFPAPGVSIYETHKHQCLSLSESIKYVD